MGITTKSQKTRLRRQRQAKRVRTANSKDGAAQVHAPTNFYDLISEAQTKALKPFIAEQVKVLGQAIAKNIIQITANYNLRLNVLESIVVNKGFIENREVLLELYNDEEDKALGFVKSNTEAQIGDYVRFTALDMTKPEATLQHLSVEKLATEPFEANETAEKAMVGMLPGQKKIVDCPMPQGGTFAFEITVVRISKPIKKDTPAT